MLSLNQLSKLATLIIVASAVVLSSCEQPNENLDRAQAFVGYYSFEENGSLTMNGVTQDFTNKGNFAVTRKSDLVIIFTGDFSGVATIAPDGTHFQIEDDVAVGTTTDGVVLRFDNTYYDCTFNPYSSVLEWKTNAVVSATYNGTTVNGVYQSSTIAKKQ